MPLGLMPDISYEETEGFVGQGERCCCTRTGWSSTRPDREMYGFPRLREAMAVDDAGSALLDRLLEELHAFTGPDWEQEDDITLVTLRRAIRRVAMRCRHATTRAEAIPTTRLLASPARARQRALAR